MKKINLSVIAGLAALLAAQVVLAHAQLTSSTPADEAVVDAPPQALVMRFSEPVRLTSVTLTLAGAAPLQIDSLPAETAAELSVAMPNLEPGRYVASWRALSQDTHVMSGEIAFTVSAEAVSAEGVSAEGVSAEAIGEADDATDAHSAHSAH